jgi:predicted hotdog family 3-hydroxylacyl-ACP dehydratase
MLVNRSEIENMIPHTGTMCLLDGVLQWNATTIQCVSSSHRAPDNPLRSHSQLPTLCGIEYAAQAMAVHGGLAGIVGHKPRAGYLVGLRDVVCHVARLDDLADDLIIDVEQIMGDASLAIYQFSLWAGAAELLRGRATVVLDAGEGAT